MGQYCFDSHNSQRHHPIVPPIRPPSASRPPTTPLSTRSHTYLPLFIPDTHTHSSPHLGFSKAFTTFHYVSRRPEKQVGVRVKSQENPNMWGRPGHLPHPWSLLQDLYYISTRGCARYLQREGAHGARAKARVTMMRFTCTDGTQSGDRMVFCYVCGSHMCVLVE